MKTYNSIIENIKTAVLQEQQQKLLIESIKELKVLYGIEITTEFLKSFVDGSNRKKTNRIFYLIKSAGLKTESIIKESKKREIARFKTPIIDYRRNKAGAVFIHSLKVQNCCLELKRHYNKELFKIVV